MGHRVGGGGVGRIRNGIVHIRRGGILGLVLSRERMGGWWEKSNVVW